ncbi:hypothetical protein M9458_021106, partial [Cirrhinus mrigala]
SHMDLTRFPESSLQNTLPTKDPAACKTLIAMDPADRLVRLRRGNQSIENYTADFCDLCYQVDFKESFLKDIFRFGLNKDISSKMPRNILHWTLVRYIDFALLLGGSAFTVGITDEGPRDPPVPTKPKPAHAMPVKPEPFHIMPATQKPHCTTSATPRSAHVTSPAPKPAHVMPAKPKSAQVTSTKPRSANVTSAKPQPAHTIPAAPRPVHVTSSAPGPAHAKP